MKNVIILIVDDDKNICEYLKRRLSPLGCRIEVAYSLHEGLHLMETLNPSPSFIFLDLCFPDARPATTLESIAKFHAINPKASIVIVTGLLDAKIQQMANTLGAAFRQKPDLRSQEDVWQSIEEAIKIGKENGIEPYEITTNVLARIAELRQPLVNEKENEADKQP